MSVNPQENVKENAQEIAVPEQSKRDENFAKVRRQLEEERQEKSRLAQENAELRSQVSGKASSSADEDNYEEPYIDKKYFNKNLAKSMQQVQEEADRRAEVKMKKLLEEERTKAWIKSNPDFNEVMQHAQKFAEKDPELAETILEMPEGFERQKLVYKNIKALGLHRPEEKKETVQDKIDRNRRGPYYQPSTMGAAPYGNSGDYSASGQKNAYDQMKALQSRLRLG